MVALSVAAAASSACSRRPPPRPFGPAVYSSTELRSTDLRDVPHVARREIERRPRSRGSQLGGRGAIGETKQTHPQDRQRDDLQANRSGSAAQLDDGQMLPALNVAHRESELVAIGLAATRAATQLATRSAPPQSRGRLAPTHGELHRRPEASARHQAASRRLTGQSTNRLAPDRRTRLGRFANHAVSVNFDRPRTQPSLGTSSSDVREIAQISAPQLGGALHTV